MPTRMITLLCVLLLLGACSQTPNLSQWSQNSAALKQSISEVNNDVLLQTDQALDALEAGKEDNWQVMPNERLSQWLERRKELTEAMSTIDAGMTAMVKYSQALSNLAATGDTGQQSAEELFTALSSINNTLGSFFPPALAASKGLEQLTTEIAAIATKVKAQGELAKGMKNAQPNVDALMQIVATSSQALSVLVGPIASIRENAVTGRYGKERIRFYLREKSYQQMENLFKQGDRAVLIESLPLLEKMAGEYSAYQSEIAQVRQWRAAKRQQLASIQKAAKEWAQTHHQVQIFLEKCGGFKSLRYECGNFNATNLMDAQYRIENLRSALSVE